VPSPACPFPAERRLDLSGAIKPAGGRAPLTRALRLLLPVLLLAAVAAAVDPRAALGVVERADPWWILAAVACVQVQVLGSAWRWRYTAGRLGLPIPYGRAAREYYLASLLNMVMPGAVAGDVLRTVRAARAEGGPPLRPVLRSVVLERLAGQVAFFVISAAGLITAAAAGMGLPAGVEAVVAGVPLVLGTGLALTAIAARLGPRRVRAALADLWPDVRRAWFAGGAWLVQGITSLAIASAYVAAFAAAGHAVGAPLPPLAVVTLIPLALLAMLVPVSIGGWGVREGAAALLWPLAGLGSAEGAVTAALYGVVAVIGALPGLLTMWPGRDQRARA
jgi:uncharacterized membrane protein YbhN (UPF0104 family)